MATYSIGACGCCVPHCFYYWECTWTCSGSSGSWSGVGARQSAGCLSSRPTNPLTSAPVTLGAWELWSQDGSTCTYRWYARGATCAADEDCDGSGVEAP